MVLESSLRSEEFKSEFKSSSWVKGGSHLLGKISFKVSIQHGLHLSLLVVPHLEP